MDDRHRSAACRVKDQPMDASRTALPRSSARIYMGLSGCASTTTANGARASLTALGRTPVAPMMPPSAALTYARRYGLFALVGIAGEDDLLRSVLVSRLSLPPAVFVLVSRTEGTRLF